MIIPINQIHLPIINGFTQLFWQGNKLIWWIASLALIITAVFLILITPHMRKTNLYHFIAYSITALGMTFTLSGVIVDTINKPTVYDINKSLPSLKQLPIKYTYGKHHLINGINNSKGKRLIKVSWYKPDKLKLTPQNQGGRDLLVLAKNFKKYKKIDKSDNVKYVINQKASYVAYQMPYTVEKKTKKTATYINTARKYEIRVVNNDLVRKKISK